LVQISKGYVPSRYGQLHYRIAHDDASVTAPPLLCLHQTPSSGKEWLPVMPALARNRVVIAVDNPGYGMSDAPPEPVTIEDFAAVAADLMSQLAEQGAVPAGPFDVIGYHTGSVVATELARSLPDRVRRAVMFGLAAYPADLRTEKLRTLWDKFPAPDRSLRHVEQHWALVQSLIDDRMTAEAMHIAMAESLALGTRLPWGYVSVYGYDFLGAMPQVHQPVLIMNPQDDLHEVTLRTADRFPNGRRVDMPGVAHGVLTIEHDKVVAYIEDFLDA
jgi:pimeloyl-ACP methyl ester carboxylesterase